MSKVDVIINKIGLEKKEAEWICDLSKKHSIWIANQVKKNPGLINCKEDFKIIIKWKKEDQKYNLNDLSFSRASSLSKEFYSDDLVFKSSPDSLKNKKLYLDLGEYKWVELRTKKDCKEEGRYMSNCLADDAGSSVANGKKVVYSLRDIYNCPVVTMDVTFKSGRISNLFGKANSTVKDKYTSYVAEFMEHNELWKKIISSYGAHQMSDTIANVLVYAIENEMYDLVTRIIRGTSLDFKGLIRDSLKSKFTKKSFVEMGLFVIPKETKNWIFDEQKREEIIPHISKRRMAQKNEIEAVKEVKKETNSATSSRFKAFCLNVLGIK